MPPADVVRTYLELPSRDALRGAPAPRAGLRVVREHPCPVPLFRELYRGVGAAYHWTDRDAWSDAQLAEHFARADVAVWVLRDGETLAGYFELESHPDGSVEIVHFGLMPAAIGRGTGKFLLTRAVEEAWNAGATRVWLHTCSLDGPAALPNYLARGFVPFREERYVAMLPDEPESG